MQTCLIVMLYIHCQVNAEDRIKHQALYSITATNGVIVRLMVGQADPQLNTD
jgi:hypothetical protein